MIIPTKHTNIHIGEAFGIAFFYSPGWSVYILIGFVGINIFRR